MDCGICLSTEQHGESILLSCSHGFHTACIAQWFPNEKTCPYCRARFKLLDILRILIFRKEIVLDPSKDKLFSYLLNNNINILDSKTSTCLKIFYNFFNSLIAVYDYTLSRKPSLRNVYVLKCLKELVESFRSGSRDNLDVTYVRKDLSVIENFSFFLKYDMERINERLVCVENIHDELSSSEDSLSETDDESFLERDSVEPMDFTESIVTNEDSMDISE